MDNIFDILSSGKGTINEENISAFLGWLLTPAPKGLGDTFLEHVLKMMDIDMNEEDDIKKVKVILEAECQLEEHRRRYIDILIELPTKVIAIENKIWEQSKRVNQISEQRCGLENKYPKKEIINVLLSHENDKSETPNSITWNDLITEIESVNQKNPNLYVNDFIDYMREDNKKTFKLSDGEYKIEKHWSGAYNLYQNNIQLKQKAKSTFWDKYIEIAPEKKLTYKKCTTRSLGRLLYNALE